MTCTHLLAVYGPLDDLLLVVRDLLLESWHVPLIITNEMFTEACQEGCPSAVSFAVCAMGWDHLPDPRLTGVTAGTEEGDHVRQS